MKKVLILSNSLDIHADVVELALKKTGADALRINTDKFFSDKVELIFTNQSSEKSGIVVNGVWCAFNQIMSILYRRPENLEIVVSNAYQKDFAEKELEELLKQIYFCSDDILYVSKYHALDAARRKFPQLKIAEKFNMRTPKTLITNSVGEIKKFFMKCKGKIIYKTLKSPVIKPMEGPELWGVPTTLVSCEHLKRIDLIRNTGGIFQEYIEKDYEVRVTVIGNDVFAAKINSQTDASGKIDWRDAVAKGLVKVEPYDLPEIVVRQCKSIIADYGLNFGAIDLILTPEKEYVFLEINCNGQWLWVEDLTNQPLIDSMVGLLIKTRSSLVR